MIGKRTAALPALCFGAIAFPCVGAVVTPPAWVRKPDTEAFARVWPSESYRRGQGGSALVTCKVTIEGTLVDCKVVKETPAGLGFGPAALMLTPSFLMSPQKVDGVPVPGARVTIPINFKLDGARPGMGGRDIKVAAWAPWAAAPGAGDVAAAYPERAKARQVAGHVVLRCGVRVDGGLRSCDTISENPVGAGFAGAARDLSRKFRARLGPEDLKTIRSGDLRVVVAIHFPKPASESAYVAQVDWLRLPDPVKAHEVFPEKAIAAKVLEGRAVLDCLIQPTGKLGRCKVNSESPSGFGFGESASLVAASMQANLWTRDGQPTPGARIALPIVIDDKDEPPPPEAASAAVKGAPPHSR